MPTQQKSTMANPVIVKWRIPSVTSHSDANAAPPDDHQRGEGVLSYSGYKSSAATASIF
jgi:hypothetical protein